MHLEQLMQTVLRLNGAATALAALGAHLRVCTEHMECDPALATRLVDVAGLVAPGADTLPPEARHAVIGAARGFLRQALHLLEHPDAPVGWNYDDPAILQSQGRGSMVMVEVIASAAQRLASLESRLAGPDARFLDLGTGVGWIAIAAARRYPTLRAVGIDIFGPALALARQNVEASGLAGRVELRQHDILALDDTDAYDLVWLPAPFIAREVVVQALPRMLRALRPGGWLVVGAWSASEDPLTSRLTDLRTVRSGGHPWSPDELVSTITSAGFVQAEACDTPPGTPMQLFAGRRPE